jgi:hypothetical protein
MKLEEYLQEKLKEYNSKTDLTKEEEGYIGAITEIATLIGLRTDMHYEITKITKTQFLFTKIFEEDNDEEITIENFINNKNVDKIEIKVIEGLLTGGCYDDIIYKSNERVVGRYDSWEMGQTPNYVQLSFTDGLWEPRFMENFLEYITSGLFLYNGHYHKTSMDGLSSGSTWRNIYQKNKVEELFEQDLIDYLKEKNIILSLIYETHDDT